jgi:tetratricopeptide (TPR) repeat protein
MKAFRLLIKLSLLILVAGCASIQLGSEFMAGRQALLKGNDEAALGYFQSVAQKDPNYVWGTPLRESVLSYLGRAEYYTGNFPQARQTLEKTLSANRDANIARLYLGLTLVRSGNRAQGLKEMEAGMKGINDWLNYITEAQRFSFGQYWDPGHDIRSAIQTQLAMIAGKETSLPTIVADGEWLGMRMEEEVDRAQRQESEDHSRDSEGSPDQPN